MCVLAFAWNAHPRWRLVLAGNRDELHERPAAPLARWREPDHILAGRDLLAGGTWLGVSEQGRLAVVTNLRGFGPPAPDMASRGALVRDVLAGDGAHADPDAIEPMVIAPPLGSSASHTVNGWRRTSSSIASAIDSACLRTIGSALLCVVLLITAMMPATAAPTITMNMMSSTSERPRDLLRAPDKMTRADVLPSFSRVSRGFEDHVSEPANAQLDAASWDGRGVAKRRGGGRNDYFNAVTLNMTTGRWNPLSTASPAGSALTLASIRP